MISLCLLAHGNPIELINTIDSWYGVDEVIIGDLFILNEDRDYFHANYKNRVHTLVVPLPFNYIFKNGFSNTMNFVTNHSRNDWVIWTGIADRLASDIIPPSGNFNCLGFTGLHNGHLYSNFYNKKEMHFDGLIHEEVIPLPGFEKRLDYNPHFSIQEVAKDADERKAAIYNDVKQIVYCEQYRRIVKHPELKGITADYWVNIAKKEYNDILITLTRKAGRYNAFRTGDINEYLTRVDRINNGEIDIVDLQKERNSIATDEI